VKYVITTKTLPGRRWNPEAGEVDVVMFPAGTVCVDNGEEHRLSNDDPVTHYLAVMGSHDEIWHAPLDGFVEHDPEVTT
jgi:hypothetical protein